MSARSFGWCQTKPTSPKTTGLARRKLPQACRPDNIAVGHLVIAQEAKWDGWWEAIVLARDGDMLTLKWRDYPWQPNVLRHAGSVALLKPGPVA